MNSMEFPLGSALSTQIEKYLLEVKDDILYFLSIPSIPLLFDGLGYPLFFHFHFTFLPLLPQLRKQFRLEFARQTNRTEFIQWSKEIVDDPQETLAKIWDSEVRENERKFKVTMSRGQRPARARSLLNGVVSDEEGGGGLSTSTWITTRLRKATPSKSNKRNAGVDWKGPLATFLNGAKTPASSDAQIPMIEGFLGDKAWVKRAARRKPSRRAILI